MSKLLTFWTINFLHALCLFLVLSTVQQIKVRQIVRKAVSWHIMFECQSEDSTEDSRSIGSAMMTIKVQQHASFILIVLIRKELPNLLIRSRPWLTTIPACQSGPQPRIWKYLTFLSARLYMKTFGISHTRWEREKF